MSHALAIAEIHCPIALFDPQEIKIDALSMAINAAKTPFEKMSHARTLIDEVRILLECESYDRSNANCGFCRQFSEIRFKTASLIVKVGASRAAH